MAIYERFKDYLHVVAATIVDGSGNVLIAKRHEHLHQGGLWEFPGGKLEQGEDIEAGLRRELLEELGIVVTRCRHRISVPYEYPGRKVYLDVWQVEDYRGTPHGREGQEVRWVHISSLSDYQFPAANLPIINSLHLPDHYLITPEPDAEAEWQVFLDNLESSLVAGIRLVQLRSKLLAETELQRLARTCVELCHHYGARLMINAEPMQALRMGVDGCHLSSDRLMVLKTRPDGFSGLLAASCHTEQELFHACRIGCDFAVLSPVKPTTSHPDAMPLGWEKFSSLAQASSIPVYALGGMSRADTPVAWENGGQGIAAISGLWGSSSCQP